MIGKKLNFYTLKTSMILDVAAFVEKLVIL